MQFAPVSAYIYLPSQHESQLRNSRPCDSGKRASVRFIDKNGRVAFRKNAVSLELSFVALDKVWLRTCFDSLSFWQFYEFWIKLRNLCDKVCLRICFDSCSFWQFEVEDWRRYLAILSWSSRIPQRWQISLERWPTWVIPLFNIAAFWSDFVCICAVYSGRSVNDW